MPRVTIQEASRMLNVSQDVIRRNVREGKLTASREGGPNGTRWLVDIPERAEDYADDFKEGIHALARTLTPWWYDNPRRQGFAHYLESLGIEEVEPFFLVRAEGGGYLAGDGASGGGPVPGVCFGGDGAGAADGDAGVGGVRRIFPARSRAMQELRPYPDTAA